MKLLFNNTNFLVIIGAKPFDDVKGVADRVIDYIAHLDTSVLKKALLEVNAIVEITENDINTVDDEFDSDANDVDLKFTIKSIGTGEFNVNDNDKLHLLWLKVFDSVLRLSSITYWNNIISKEKSNE